MAEQGTEESLTLDKKTIDVLVAHIIPTSKYFEARFDHMQDFSPSSTGWSYTETG